MPDFNSYRNDLPRLRRQGSATQLIVDGRPFLILGGELFNSSSSSIEYMKPLWQKMVDSHLNALVVPLAWEIVEPVEGHYDWTILDGLVLEAREFGLKLVLLWLASWKNGMSSYIPLWMKRDYHRFPRVRRSEGATAEILSAFHESNRDADARAFAAVMRHIHEIDADRQTVVMMQVENEVGILGDSRDRCDAAETAYIGPVPDALMERLRQGTVPELRAIWKKAGGKNEGSWAEVFGTSPEANEVFMAWHYARYIDRVAEAGKAEYPLPMYVNAWLFAPGAVPGDYPSGSPGSHLLDVWQVGAPHIDLLSPDIYASNFAERCQLFNRQDNPLFIPEMQLSEEGARNVFYAIGAHDAIGTSPFGIDRITADSPVAASYEALAQVAPTILEHQGLGRTFGFLLDPEHPAEEIDLGGYQLAVSLDSIFGYTATQGYGLIVATDEGRYLGVGSGFRVRFRPIAAGPSRAGIGSVEEGRYVNGAWIPGRRLNGDETDQGGAWRFNSHGIGISKCEVYRYE